MSWRTASLADEMALRDLLDSLPAMQRASVERAIAAAGVDQDAIRDSYQRGFKAGRRSGMEETLEDGKRRAARIVNRTD